MLCCVWCAARCLSLRGPVLIRRLPPASRTRRSRWPSRSVRAVLLRHRCVSRQVDACRPPGATAHARTGGWHAKFAVRVRPHFHQLLCFGCHSSDDVTTDTATRPFLRSGPMLAMVSAAAMHSNPRRWLRGRGSPAWAWRWAPMPPEVPAVLAICLRQLLPLGVY